MSHRLFFALLLLPLYGPTLANGKDIVASPSSAKVSVFLDGRWMRVQRYIAVGRVVLITTTDGKLRSVPRSYVNPLLPLRGLQVSFARQKMDPRKLKNLKELSEYLGSERNTLMQSSGTVPLLDKRLDGEVELGYSYIPGEPELGGKKGAAAARLGLKGKWDRVKYWGEYGFYGKEFTNIRNPTLKDRAGGKIGAKLKLGVLGSKAELTRFHNNVQRDPTESRTIKSQGKVSFDLKVPQWPTFTLTYNRKGKETSRPNDTVRKKSSTNTVSGTLRYSRSTWEIKPSLALTRYYIYPSYDYRKERFNASLVSDYSIKERSMTLSLTGRFTANKTTDGDYDTQRFDGSIGLVKNVSNVFGLPDDKAILSVKLTYSRFIDLVHQGADLKKYSVLFLCEIGT